MAITWASVEAIAPELSDVSLASQTAILADVALQVGPNRWGSEARADIGRKYLAAHLGSMTLGGGSDAFVTSESADGVSRSYSVGSVSGSLDSSSYGLEYRRLLRSLVVSRIGMVAG